MIRTFRHLDLHNRRSEGYTNRQTNSVFIYMYVYISLYAISAIPLIAAAPMCVHCFPQWLFSIEGHCTSIEYTQVQSSLLLSPLHCLKLRVVCAACGSVRYEDRSHIQEINFCISVHQTHLRPSFALKSIKK